MDPGGSPGAPRVDAHAARAWIPVAACWACGGTQRDRFLEERLQLDAYREQAPDMAALSGQGTWFCWCRGCGHGQPEALPPLADFFDRLYDQHWSPEWVEQEFHSPVKDFIFRQLLRALGERVPGRGRSLLDVGAHAGRFLSLAQRDGWRVEGVELNPRTAGFAAAQTGAPVHHVNAHALRALGKRFTAITLTDVLEHVPDPAPLVRALAGMLEPGGWLAIKVPHGPAQWMKERALVALGPHPMSLAINLVHINHFSVASLTRVLASAGLSNISVVPGAPELPPGGWRTRAANAAKLGVYAASRLPGPLGRTATLNLQAFARLPSPPHVPA